MSSPSKMSRFWSQADVLHLVFSHLNRPEAELARRINRLCSRVGAGASWGSVALRDLMIKFPAIAWQLKRASYDSSLFINRVPIWVDNLILKRPLDKEEWQFIHSILNKILSLTVGDDFGSDFVSDPASTNVFAELIASLPYPSLLPNLTTLHLSLSPAFAQTYSLATHILNTSPLRCLCLQIQISPIRPDSDITIYTMAKGILSALVQQCPTLDTLDVGFSTPPGGVQECEAVVRASVSTVGQLPLLKHVTLSCLDYATVPSPDTLETWFHLEELRLRNCNIPAVTQCLERGARHRLNVKRLVLEDHFTYMANDHFAAFFLAVNDIFPGVESIELDNIFYHTPDGSDSLETLRVLKNFASLKTFANPRNHFLLTQEALEFLQHDMPQVEFNIQVISVAPTGWGEEIVQPQTVGWEV